MTGSVSTQGSPPTSPGRHRCARAAGGSKRYGGIDTELEMRANFRMSCIPESLLDGNVLSYDEFLEERRRLMALKIKTWFESL